MASGTAGVNVQYAFSGDVLASPASPFPVEEYQWPPLPPVAWAAPVIPQPFGWRQDVPQLPSGAGGSEGLSYGPTPYASQMRSNVRYQFSGDERAIPTPIMPPDDWWGPSRESYQLAVEPESVTIPLPFSWDMEDEWPTPNGAPEHEDGWQLQQPPKWSNPIVAAPWSFRGDDVAVSLGVDEHSQIVQPLRWARPAYPKPWTWDEAAWLNIPAPVQPDHDGQLVAPLRWASAVYPHPWAFDAITPPGGQTPPAPEIQGPAVADVLRVVSGVDVVRQGSGLEITTHHDVGIDVTVQPSGVDILS